MAVKDEFEKLGKRFTEEVRKRLAGTSHQSRRRIVDLNAYFVGSHNPLPVL